MIRSMRGRETSSVTSPNWLPLSGILTFKKMRLSVMYDVYTPIEPHFLFRSICSLRETQLRNSEISGFPVVGRLTSPGRHLVPTIQQRPITSFDTLRYPYSQLSTSREGLLMEIKVTGRKMTVSDALRAYVEEKVGNSLKVFNISPMNVEVVLRKEKNPANPKPAVAEITLVTKGHIIRTEESEEDMYAAIDVASAKTERQLRKYKTKVIDRKHNGKSLRTSFTGEEIAPPKDEHLAHLEDDNTIVRVKEIQLDALTEDEALLQIDLLGHDFFVYNDATTGSVNVMYRRKDGSYGLLKQRIETPEG